MARNGSIAVWGCVAIITLGAGFAAAAERPNILWISAEDLSASTLSGYGGAAATPRIDGLADLRFTAAYAPAPVCAPSRSGIITGMMPTTLGSLPMRCRATPPGFAVGFPRLLRSAGYYCTNNSKTDYNFSDGFDAGWDESDRKAHWRHRPDAAQPFFAVFNLLTTHESGLFGDNARRVRESLPEHLRADPAKVAVPPFYPDTPAIREALAQRLDLAAKLDRQVGAILDDLATDGLAENTIVVFWSDHGEGIPHGKRALTEHGLHVPLVVRMPDRFRAANRWRDAERRIDGLVSLIDLGPTMLDLAGIEVPPWMEGRSFLGPHAAPREFVVSAADRMDATPGFGRSVRASRYRYVRNFLPWIDGDDLPDYASGVPITGELRQARAAGTLPAGAAWFSRTSRPAEELYDVRADRHEIHDLAAAAAAAADLAHLRETLRSWMRKTRDTGLLPEPILRREASKAGSEWAIFHPAGELEDRAAARYDALLAAAWDVADQPAEAPWDARLAAEDPAVRWWAVHGIGWAAARAAAAEPRLAPRLGDSDPTVRIAAASWILKLGADDRQPALDVLAAEMAVSDPEVRRLALVAVDEAGSACQPLWPAAAALQLGPHEEYSRRTVDRIRRKLPVSDRPAAPPSAGRSGG